MKYNIKILDYDVEMYVQDADEEYHSAGSYSLIFDKWVKKPKKEKTDIDLSLVKEKAKKFEILIDDLVDTIDEYEEDDAMNTIKKLKKKIKNYRKTGLDKGGELSYENLVFKYLRRSGHIEKLWNLEKEYLSKQLSIEK